MRSWAIGLSALVIGASAYVLPAGARETTFYVVRHAERLNDPITDVPFPLRDTVLPLSEVGMRRAEELRERLRGVPLSAVYATRTLRAWQTAMPAASAAGLDISPYDVNKLVPAFFDRLKTEHAGQNVLIVSHSGKVEEIVKGLSGVVVDAIGDQFDDVFIVTVTEMGGAGHVDHQRYHVLEPHGGVTIEGLSEPKNLSGIAVGPGPGRLVVASDETTQVQVAQGGDDHYEAKAAIPLDDGHGEGEIDIEGIARHGAGNTYYVVGSHSGRRKSIFRDQDRDAKVAKLRERFEDEEAYKPQESRQRLVKLDLDPATGELVTGSKKEVNLREVLDHHNLLRHFRELPSTENGIDIEGVASDGRRLYIGFRGPVLRFGFATVLVVDPDDAKDNALRYMKLGGRGVRDIVRVDGGFLVIAGPVGDDPLAPQLYFWDGNDCLPGIRKPSEPPGRVVPLGAIPTRPDAEPEGIAVLDEAGPKYEILIIYDGPEGGDPRRFLVDKP